MCYYIIKCLQFTLITGAIVKLVCRVLLSDNRFIHKHFCKCCSSCSFLTVALADVSNVLSKYSTFLSNVNDLCQWSSQWFAANEAATVCNVLLLSLFFSLSILLSQSKVYFLVCLTLFSSVSTFICVIWCLRPPSSERDITNPSHVTPIYRNFEMPLRLLNRQWHETKLYINENKLWSNSIISKKFHATSFGLWYSLFCICFSLLISNSLWRGTVTVALLLDWYSSW